MTTTFRRRSQDEAGATMVEFALVSIVAFLLMLGLFQLGLIVLGNSAGSNAARDGARVGIIDYIGADNTASTNYAAILAAVQDNLSGTVRNLSVTARCLNGSTLAPVSCNATSVDLTRGDLIEVVATWDHKGFGPFVTTLSRSSTARMVISGRPDLTSVTSPTPTTTAPTTPTTAPSGPTKFSMASLQMQDADTDGRVDRVVATFSGGSGSFPAGCNTTAMWALANVPSGGTLSGASVSGSVVTLSINEGPGAKDTSVGLFTVAFNPTGTCAAGANSFSAVGPSDGAGPVPTAMTDPTNGAGGEPEQNDQYRVTFSEAVSPTWTSGSSVDVVFTRANSNGADSFVDIPNLVTANFNTGAKGYAKPGKTVTFSGSTLAVSGANVTVTLGSCNSSCSDTEYGKGQFDYVPSATIRDLAGNPAVSSLSSGNNYELF